MDKKYIEENNLNEARKRFQQINEYILNMNHENEAQQPQDDMGQQQAQDAPMPQQQPHKTPIQQDNMGDQQPQIQDDTNMQQGGDTGQQEDLSIDTTIGAEAENGEPTNDMSIEEPATDEDEVIDVDDLTQSQETAEYKIDGVDDKLTQLIDIVSKFSQAIEDNDEKLNDLKREIEERNPSQQERLNIRSMSGSPYTVSPQDYWSDQNARNPQYNVVGNNDVDPDKEEELYTITDDDIKNFSKSEIEKSINNFPKDLRDYL